MTSQYAPLADQIAGQYGIPAPLFESLLTHENSAWNPYKVGVTGDIGLAQINPFTNNLSELGVTNLFDPQQNLTAGAKILSSFYAQAGNWYDALRAYNGGTGALTDTSKSTDYASQILSAAGLSQLVPLPGQTTTGGAVSNSSFFSDPWGYLSDKLTSLWNGSIVPKLWAIGAVVLIAMLIYFGTKKLIEGE